jgi:hypothetical protein
VSFTGQLGNVDAKPGNIELGGVTPIIPTPPQLPRLFCEINWDDNPTLEFPPTGYTDISDRVRAFSVRRGRNNFVARVESGTATILFDNRDGYFNFTQTGRLLMRKVRLRAFYDSTIFPLITGHIESYRYSYPGTDKDAVCEITIADGMKVLAQQSFPINYVRENETPALRIGSALTTAGVGATFQSVVNTDATEVAPASFSGQELTQTRTATLTHWSASVTVSPNTTGLIAGGLVSGPGVPQGTTILSIDSGTTLTMSHAAVLLDTQNGVTGAPNSNILSNTDDSTLSVGMTVGPKNNTNGQAIFQTGTTIQAIQGSSVVINPPTNNVTFWDGVGAGGTIQCPFTAGTTQTLSFVKKFLQVQGILEHLRQIEETERGTFLVLADGTYQYQGSGYRPAQTVQLTFGEQGTEVPYLEAPVVYDDTNLINEYILNNTYNDTSIAISDATSQARYFKRSLTINQIFNPNVSSLPTDQRVFEPIPRMEGLRPMPMLAPLTNWRKLLNLAISQKVSVRRRPMEGSDIFSAYDQFIEAIEHDGVPGDWQVKFITSPVRT